MEQQQSLLKEDRRLTSSLHKVIVVCSSSDKLKLHIHAWHVSKRKWYDLSIDIQNAWENFAACSAGSKIVICGGTSGEIILSDTIIYDSFANRWEKGPDLNTARYRHGSVEVNGKVFVFGGENESFLDTIEMLDIDNGKWEVVGNLATAVSNPVFMTSRQYILVMGGFIESKNILATLNHGDQCFDAENKTTTVLKVNHACVRKGSSESSALYIIKNVPNKYTKLCRVFLEEQDGVLQLCEQTEEINLPYDLYDLNDSQFVVCDDLGFLFSKAYTRQISLCGAERNKVFLPTIPGSVSHVWSGFTMFVADRCLHRVAPSEKTTCT